MTARLLALLEVEKDLEKKIAGKASGHPVRNALAIARGHLELGLHGYRVDVERITRILAAALECCGGGVLVVPSPSSLPTPPVLELEALEEQPPAPRPRFKRTPVLRRRRPTVIRFGGRLVSLVWFRRYGAAAAA